MSKLLSIVLLAGGLVATGVATAVPASASGCTSVVCADLGESLGDGYDYCSGYVNYCPGKSCYGFINICPGREL